MHALVRKGKTLKNIDIMASGYKHAATLVMIAAMVRNLDCTIGNIPDILDTRVLLRFMKQRGHESQYENHVLKIKKCENGMVEVDNQNASMIHNILYFLPAFCPIQREMFLPNTGGCKIGTGKDGSRPVEHIIDLMQKSGAKCKEYNDGIHMSYKNGINPLDIDINHYSTSKEMAAGPLISGATKTAIFLSMHSEDTSSIRNPYMKGDVISLLEFLKSVGYEVKIERNTLYISGAPREVKDIYYQIISDPSVIITYLCLSIYLGIPLTLCGVSEKSITRELKNDIEFLRQIGVEVLYDSGKVCFDCKNGIHRGDLNVYCGNILSDHQPFYALLMSLGKDGGRITDNVWNNRFSYVKELNKMVDSFRVEGHTLHITSGEKMKGDVGLYGNDLRATAVLLIAAAARNDISIVHGLEHLERGYENFIEDLMRIGIDIQIRN